MDLDVMDYIDWDEGRDDATHSVAVMKCFNCGRGCDKLYNIPEVDYMGCEECKEEAEGVLACEVAEAAAGMRRTQPRCVNCKTRATRPDSIYCSVDEFLTFPEVA